MRLGGEETFSFRRTAGGEFIIDGEETVVNPAYRLGARQSDKLRAVDSLKRSLTHDATASRAPINLPPWDLSFGCSICFASAAKGGS